LPGKNQPKQKKVLPKAIGLDCFVSAGARQFA
jgi:hypothetical protein